MEEMYNNPELHNITNFEPLYGNRYLDNFVTGYGYVFFTCPELFLSCKDDSDNLRKMAYENMKTDPYFSQFLGSNLNSKDMILIKQLSLYDNKNSFIPIFTNRIKNLELSDYTLDTMEAYESKSGYKISMPTHGIQSESSNTLNFNLQESENQDLLKLISFWVRYISNITDGTFKANPESIAKRTIDYMNSIYYFVTEPDGITIKNYTRFTGCWPTNIPYSGFSLSKGDSSPAEIAITFNFTHKEDNNPLILEDFNRVSFNKLSSTSKDNSDHYDIKNRAMLNLKDDNIVHIETENINGSYKFLLKFPEADTKNDILNDNLYEDEKEYYIDNKFYRD